MSGFIEILFCGLLCSGLIMVTTHFMDEAEYCDRIVLIYKGKAIALGTPHSLISQVSEDATMEDTFIELIKRSSDAES